MLCCRSKKQSVHVKYILALTERTNIFLILFLKRIPWTINTVLNHVVTACTDTTPENILETVQCFDHHKGINPHCIGVAAEMSETDISKQKRIKTELLAWLHTTRSM